MKKTSRQRITSTIGVMLMTGSSSAWVLLASIERVLPTGTRPGWALTLKSPRLMPVGLGRRDRDVAPIGWREPLRLAGDQLDDLPRAVIQLADQEVHAIEEDVVERDGDHGD